MPMRLAVIVLVGANLTMDVAPFVAATSPSRKMPAEPALTVNALSAVMSTVTAVLKVPPVAAPTWKSAPLATKVPPSVKLTLVTSARLVSEPKVLVPVVVKVLPEPIRTTAEATLVVVPAVIPPIV